MSRQDRLKEAFSAWKSDQNLTTVNDMFEEVIPFARSVVRSVVRREDLHDEAESSVSMLIFRSINPEIGNIVAWVRTVARNAAINVLRGVTSTRIDPDANLEIIPGKRGLDLHGLSAEQGLVAQLLSQGNSQRQIMADTGLSRRRLKAAMAAIAEHLMPAERKVA
jgi:DNA-directed RNA polymerase specialized sigma24 family protein